MSGFSDNIMRLSGRMLSQYPAQRDWDGKLTMAPHPGIIPTFSIVTLSDNVPES